MATTQRRRYIVRARTGKASEWAVYDRRTRQYVEVGLPRDEAYAVRDKYEGGAAMKVEARRR